MSKVKKPRLGRGLSSLISTPVAVQPVSPAGSESGDLPAPMNPAMVPHSDHSGLTWVAIDAIHANPFQPRRHFDPKALEQLAESIRQDGLIQPIIVRLSRDQDGYELVAGERRWRAAKSAGLSAIPAVVRELDDRQIAEWAIVENLQREDLDPIEKAHAYARLIDQFKLTHGDVAERVGTDRSTITNALRLLDLGEEIQQLVRMNQISAGHARALLGVSDAEAQQMLVRQLIKEEWSVRQTEEKVRGLSQEPTSRQSKKQTRSAHLQDLERNASAQIGAKIRIKPGRKKGVGTLSIDYYNLDHFDPKFSRG